jgi:hypothetical protein
MFIISKKVTQISIIRPAFVEDDESKISLRIKVIQLQIIVSNIVEDFNSNHSIMKALMVELNFSCR